MVVVWVAGAVVVWLVVGVRVAVWIGVVVVVAVIKMNAAILQVAVYKTGSWAWSRSTK